MVKCSGPEYYLRLTELGVKLTIGRVDGSKGVPYVITGSAVDRADDTRSSFWQIAE